MFSLFPENPLIKGVILTIISYLFLALSSVFVKLTSHDFTIWQILFYQNLICLILSIIYFQKRKTLSFKTKKISLHFYRALFGISCYWTFYKALSLLDLVDATVITYTAPFFIPIISKLWIKEPVEKEIWWSIILGFLGMVFILKPGDNLVWGLGIFIALIAAITTAASIVSIRVLNTNKESLSSMLLYFFLIGTIVSFPLALEHWAWPSLSNILFVMFVGVSTFFGQILINAAYSYGTAAFLSPLCYFIVIFNFIFSWIIFHSIPSWNAFVGSFLIILGGSLTFILKTKQKSFPEVFSQKALEKPWWKRLFHRFK